MRVHPLGVVFLVVACHHDPDHPIDASPDADDGVMRGEVLNVPATENRDIDLLFMVDDSPSTLDKQAKLKASFPTLINVIDALPYGRPSIQIGVVTSDLGTSATDGMVGAMVGSGPGSCSGSGKMGNLQTFGTNLVTGAYIYDVANPDGSRSTNYTGPLASAFSAIASAGSFGCGFEQPIEAVQRALDNNPANAGFLRSNANLAVIFLTDEDDCSLAHTDLIGPDTATFGPLLSFRCTRFGVTCDVNGQTTDAMNNPDLKDQCHSNESGAHLTKVADHVAFLKGLKHDPRTIMVGSFAGPATPVEVELRPPGGGGTAVPALKHSCMYTDTMNQTEVADPAVRVNELATQFQHHVVSSVCDDLAPGLDQFGRELATLLGSSTCLTRTIVQPANCVVTDQTLTGSPVAIPACPATGRDCYSIVADSAACPTLQNLKLVVDRVAQPPADTVTTVKCVLP